jgi:PAS domain S-box-containing protein
MRIFAQGMGTPSNWPLAPDVDHGDPFTPPGPLVAAVRDSWRVRLLLGLALGLIGALLHAALIRAAEPNLSLAAVYPCVAAAVLLGGPTAALATLAISALALWRLSPPGDASAVFDLALFILGGAFVAGVSVVTRATRRRLTTDAVRRNQERLRLAVEAGAIGLFEADFTTGKAIFTGKEREILGFPPDGPVSPYDVAALVVEEDRAQREQALAAAMKPDGNGVYVAKYRIRRANDGALRWVSARGQAYFEYGRIARVVGVNRDITDEMNAEATLQDKARLAEQLASLAGTLPGAIYSYERPGDGPDFMPYASANIEDLYGFGPETFARDMSAFVERVHADDMAGVFAAIDESQQRMTPWRSTFRYHHPRKGVVWIEGDSAPVHNGITGSVVWHGYVHDVTERKNAESALAASEARARAVIEGAAEAIFTFDDAGIIKSANAASVRMFGYAVEEMIGSTVCQLMAESLRAENISRLCERVGKGDAGDFSGSREVQGLRKDGELFPMWMTVSQARFGNARLFVGFARDLTEQRRIEARVRQLNDERLASLESVAASLAHEVNQPLAAGATFLTVARRMLAAPERAGAAKIEQALEKAAEQMVRAGKIITRARQFSRRGEPDKTFQSLRELIHGVCRALGDDRKLADFRLIEKLDEGDDRVLVDRVQIAQVLVNLIRNAVQSTGGAGSPDQGRPRDIVVATAREQDAIRVSVIDEGDGLSDQAQKSLFEPFFTTKPEGMGVGLSISRAIIEAHFGKIWAESNPGGGAIFSFTLPLVEMEET